MSTAIEIRMSIAPHRTKSLTPEEIAQRNALIRRGELSLDKIAHILGLKARQTISLYIKNTGQDEVRQEAVRQAQKPLEEEKTRVKTLQEIVGATIQHALEHATEPERQAYLKMQEYDALRVHQRRLPFNQVYTLFQTYFEAKQQGKKLSLAELAETAGTHQTTVGDLLHEMGLAPMYWTVEKMIRTTAEKREQIKRAAPIQMRKGDLCYFLQVNPSVFVEYTKGLARPQIRNKTIGKNCGPKHFSHETASKVYEAQDLGFTVAETAELLGINENAVKHYAEQIDVYGVEIINALRTIYPGEQITRPYLADIRT